MTVTYNHNRSYDERRKRWRELDAKRCSQSEAKYCVITNRDAAWGQFDYTGNDVTYFTHRATAIAWAQHYSDISDHCAGVFKMPEFICRVDVR